MTKEQFKALSALCERYEAPFVPWAWRDGSGLAGLPDGYVFGCVQKPGRAYLWCGCCPEGRISS